MPINQFEKKKENFYEKRISIKNNQFQIIRKKSNYLHYKFSELKDGNILEISPLSNLYLNKVFNHISNFGGGIIIFDYGPFQKKKLTHFKLYERKKCDFLKYPYEADITYHIDFQDIKQKSYKFGLKVYGPISQKIFILQRN